MSVSVSLQDKHQREWEELKRRQREELTHAKQQQKQKQKAKATAKPKSKIETDSASETETDTDAESDESESGEKRSPRRPPRSAAFFDLEEDESSPQKKGKNVRFERHARESEEDRNAADQRREEQRRERDWERQRTERARSDGRYKEAKDKKTRYKLEQEAHDKMLARVPTKKPLGVLDLFDRAEPKKPANAFFLFKKDVEPELVRQKLLDKAAGVTQCSKIVSQQWKLCPAEMKDKYERQYRKNLVAYREECDRFEAKVWVAAQMEDYIREFKLGALHEKELDDHCRDFFRQYDAMSRSEKDALKLSRKRRVRKAKQAIDKASNVKT
jgi:hypothetical protein